jgi:pimeloyl-ACP methyl ester carboxylesterase
MSRERQIAVGDETLAVIDHGGTGPAVLLVHGTGQNAAAYGEVAGRLVPDHRVVALDLRGHGRSRASSQNAEQYWRDLGPVVQALGWDRPLLVGHSTGGYAVTAATAAGLVNPSGLCLIDGLVLDDRAAATRALADLRAPAARDELARKFGYGLCLDGTGLCAWIEEQVRTADTDWLNAGASPALVRAVAARSFLSDGAGTYLRRPTMTEVLATATPDPAAPVFPGVDVYQRIGCPVTMVVPADGFYAVRRAEIDAVVAAEPSRTIVDVSAGHNVIMTRPERVAAIIRTCAAAQPARIR